MGDISKIKIPNGEEYDLKDVNGRKEAYLTWGGKHFSYSYGPIDAAMIGALGANRFAFLKAAGLTIEYSTNGGETWIDYESTDIQKTGLFGNGSGFYLGKHIAEGSSTLGDMLRITIATEAAGIYTTLNKIAIFMSRNGNIVQVKMEKALESTPDNYSTHLDWTGISGWSGWNILNISNLPTYGNTPSSQYGRIRFIFKQTATTTTYPAANISIIMGFGGLGWVTPSNMAKTGHLYAYDNAQNATFPAQVNASVFNGSGSLLTSLNGSNISTGTIAAARIANLDASKITTGVLPIARGGTGQTTVFNASNKFLNALPTGSNVPDDDDCYISQISGGGSTSITTYVRKPISVLWQYIKNKISSVLGLTAINYDGSAAKVNNHTVESDVPANAQFTDTTYNNATSTSAGLMSASDKVIVNEISSIYATKTESSNHIVASKTQPSNQQAGDIWLVISQ